MNQFWINALVLCSLGAVQFFVLRAACFYWIKQNQGPKWLKQHGMTVNLVLLSAVALTLLAALSIHYVTTVARQLPKRSQFVVSAARFLEDEPQLIDLVVANQGRAAGKLEQVEFTIHRVYRLVPHTPRDAAHQPSKKYRVELDNSPTPYKRTVSCPYEIPPDRAEHLQIELVTKSSEAAVDFVYEFSLEFQGGNDAVSAGPFLYLGNVGFYSPPPEMDKETEAVFQKLAQSSHLKNPILASLLTRFAKTEKAEPSR